ncbi:hypothetical protein QYE76_009154 [Lolium multiflorum]|uniref:Uncharacterized protein n=1 Tax=Lolium multiflorum TaxID=4521 RepID=A0AAD8TUN9_LOLMU|nr:hypothetical protein QYE76_009154 [Lolium multiflorum]
MVECAAWGRKMKIGMEGRKRDGGETLAPPVEVEVKMALEVVGEGGVGLRKRRGREEGGDTCLSLPPSSLNSTNIFTCSSVSAYMPSGFRHVLPTDTESEAR